MSSWRDAILAEFVPNVSKLTLVSDPDGLLTEEKLAFDLRERGFDLIEFTDPVEFRYAYESQYRSIWDQGEQTDLVVVLRLRDQGLASLPYDLVTAGRKLSFSLGELFPNLSYPVVEKLDQSLLDDLFEAQRKTPPDRMGDNATKDFVLRHVFGIAAELITSEIDLLRALLRLHYGKLQIPHVLAERLVKVLSGQTELGQWPLHEIVPDEEAFFAFLQERWPQFLSTLAIVRRANDEEPSYRLKYAGPDSLPFDHQDIRVYIDNLFLEGKLTPVPMAGVELEANAWYRSGITMAGADDEGMRASRLFDLVETERPAPDARYTDWIAFALKWAELSALVHSGSGAEHRERLRRFGDALNEDFAAWLAGHYASLVNLPPTNPAMVHHVPRRLARHIDESSENRTALIVVDGLALDQWVSVRQILQDQIPGLIMRESATFAWIPTLTSVSRQAIFAGKPPFYFPQSILSTNSEEKLWKQFWEGHGLSRPDVSYQRSLGDGDGQDVLDGLIHPERTRAVGLVVDTVDKVMHGMQLGAAGMHNQTRQWCERGFLSTLINQLLDQQFDVWLTADHGNIECDGRGRPSEGVLAETRGERVRVYPTEDLRSRTAAEFSFAEPWAPVGLPPGYYPLVAKGHDAFVSPGQSIVGHGGIAVEEVIVPLVQFSRPST